MCDLQAGDTVRLKSGGKHMTVSEASDGPGPVSCTWMLSGEVKCKTFQCEVLEKSTPSKGAVL